VAEDHPALFHHPLAQGVRGRLEEDHVDAAFRGEVGEIHGEALLQAVSEEVALFRFLLVGGEDRDVQVTPRALVAARPRSEDEQGEDAPGVFDRIADPLFEHCHSGGSLAAENLPPVYQFGVSADQIVSITSASSIRRYSGSRPECSRLSRRMIGTPSPRFSMK